MNNNNCLSRLDLSIDHSLNWDVKNNQIVSQAFLSPDEANIYIDLLRNNLSLDFTKSEQNGKHYLKKYPHKIPKSFEQPINNLERLLFSNKNQIDYATKYIQKNPSTCPFLLEVRQVLSIWHSKDKYGLIYIDKWYQTVEIPLRKQDILDLGFKI